MQELQWKKYPAYIFYEYFIYLFTLMEHAIIMASNFNKVLGVLVDHGFTSSKF